MYDITASHLYRHAQQLRKVADSGLGILAFGNKSFFEYILISAYLLLFKAFGFNVMSPFILLSRVYIQIFSIFAAFGGNMSNLPASRQVPKDDLRGDRRDAHA